ncbi:hypothetical protein SAMN05446037_1006137 [Anaerovirgula multivorans]|uniref:Uncharacterized protein n=1 Tax=Anaerovirgula multivorans TaxID=312168 RepID=A0A239CSN1_9FIRM|nr:hypothetical protein [Anaerovirgula multivorans]SNS23256.1 hypothetical protein SAMN05446037_1006137 [Anaerovirgula multivorans]
MKYKTIEEATKACVGEFNAIPYALIEKAYKNDIDSFYELTKPAIGDYVHVFSLNSEAEITGYDSDTGKYKVTTSDGSVSLVDEYAMEVYYDAWLPMWGWMWNPQSSLDEEWVVDNLQTVSDLGVRIYECDEVGILLGIDGAGYKHWIPLYKARGLRWHE